VSHPKATTTRASVPLSAIALSFFLPMADTCNHVVSPFRYVREGSAGGALWVVPTFAAAAVLAVAAWRSQRGAARTRSGLLATAALVCTLPVLAVLFLATGAHVLAALYAVAGVASIGLLGRTRRKTGHERLAAVLDAYAVAALPLATSIALIGRYWGAYVFVVAYAALASQRLWLLAARRAPAGGARVRVAVPAVAQAPRVRVEEQELAAFDDELERWVEGREARAARR
jgi:hypothetical protein